MKYFFLVCLLAFSGSLFAQTDTKDWVYEYTNGKKYAVHIAQAGNTLWGLHTTYNVPVDDIVAANPGIEKGVKEGYRYLIPLGGADMTVASGTTMREHTVEKGETAFSIAKKYNSSVDDLLKYNPGIDKGLKAGQVLKVVLPPASGEIPPKQPEKQGAIMTSVTFTDTVLVYEVKNSETLYTISKRFMVPVNDLQTFNNLKSANIKAGDILKIPLKKENVKQVSIREVQPKEEARKVDETLIFKAKNKYNIAVLLSFGFNDSKVNTGLRNLATEFYMGVELAADSLEKLGFDATIKVIDLPMDSVGIMKVLNTAEMKDMDLIFGPLVPQSADIVGRWCGKQKIRMICPSACNSSLLKNNPYIYASVTTDMTQQEILAKYTIEKFKTAQIILVNPGISKDQELFDAYRKRFIELSRKNGNVKLIEAKLSDYTTFIRKSGESVIVLPTKDKGTVLSFINSLHKAIGKSPNADVTVMGVKEWGGFDDITGYYKTRYKMTWASSSDLNFSLPDTQTLLRLYRKKYRADMNKAGAHGFDVVYYFVKTLLMKEEVPNEVMNAFDLKAAVPGGGYENRSCFILTHQNYELIRVGVFYE
ncbi:LysM peptidoglycan-binding domain-containing protein [Fluviicola sp.]|jgi:LysM repeat protein/ABC-type branched-subunit amino acid transport system substrate-binding protein|uniref:PBP1 and LysM peptidoglycan-binding domain-containing protein n=1 Tax=Fluviicola sp. TaxID=1917219 RepID=UPI00282B89C7|nr:LysM peptidoglycan-binding domain-containing protein [Fluviicola sp.]MDR0802469.1 LysM peptidoglycan-binding domain-containing protein [Fluviicola sp.]